MCIYLYEYSTCEQMDIPYWEMGSFEFYAHPQCHGKKMSLHV